MAIALSLSGKRSVPSALGLSAMARHYSALAGIAHCQAIAPLAHNEKRQHGAHAGV